MSDEDNSPVGEILSEDILALDELIRMRGEVVHRFAAIESALDMMVALHMFQGRLSEFFVKDICSNEHFSWALRVSVFERFIEHELHMNKKEVDALVNALRRLATLRNLFAHAGRTFQETYNGPEFFIDPKKHDSRIEFRALKKEFEEKFALANNLLKPISMAVIARFPPEKFKGLSKP